MECKILVKFLKINFQKNLKISHCGLCRPLLGRSKHVICKVLWLLRASGEKYLGFVWQIRCNLRHLARLHKDAFWKYFFRWKFSKVMLHSVLEPISIKGSYLSQWLPQGERGPSKESKSRWIEILHGGSQFT